MAQGAARPEESPGPLPGNTKRKIRAAKNDVKDRLDASEAKVAQLVAENDELKLGLKRVLAPLDCPAGLLQQPFEPLHCWGTLASTTSLAELSFR